MGVGRIMEREFDPSVDGWYFENWGETSLYCIGCARSAGHTGPCEFTWDLYRDTYLGINPTHDCLEAPLDCAFYEIFKACATDGNCGGMSLLALALFKYGGYMGFCSPASFYTGTESPDRDDLHRVINILQARQFSARGIMNFIEVYDANNINNAQDAYTKVKEHLARGDYTILSIANDALGDAAHTVIPYKAEIDSSGTKVMHIWDPNFPHDDYPGHYGGSNELLVINGPFDWNYSPSPDKTYSGAGGGWCFVVPMSLVLSKSRQPMALELFAEALITLFVSGPGSAVSQISDDEGRRLYTTDVDVHASRLEFETDPETRLKGVIRWPWYFSNKGHKIPGELYFMRRRRSKTSPLNVTISGTNYRMIKCMGKNLIEINSDSKEHARDTIKTYGLISDAVSMDITTTGKKREISISHLLTGATNKEWRRYQLRNIRLPKKVPITINMGKKMRAMAVSCREKEVKFELDIQQRFKGRVTTKNVGEVSTIPGKILRLAPKKWKILEKSKLIKDVLEKDEKSKRLTSKEKTFYKRDQSSES